MQRQHSIVPLNVSASARVRDGSSRAILFLTLSYAQLALLLLMAPIFSAGAITIEKEQRAPAALLASLLTPLQIWLGKFAS